MTAGRYLGDAIDSGWVRAVKVDADKSVLFYPDGTVRFGHRCDRGDRGIVDCAPALQIGHGHTVTQDDPVTIVASILCEDCGTHGWVTDGRWVE
jgi:hypothetical protein